MFYLNKLSEIIIVFWGIIWKIYYFAIIITEKLKKVEVKREKIAGKLEELMCRCRRATAEEINVEYSSCSDAGNGLS